MDPLVGRRPLAFLIRVQRFKEGIRGQVVAVATGVSRLFDNLRDAMAFIEGQVREEREAQDDEQHVE